MKRFFPWIGLAVVVVITLFLFLGKGTEMERLKVAAFYVAIVVVLLYALVVLVAIVTGEISLTNLLTESGGGASMSRFQLLIFTLIIAICLVLIVVSNGDFPKIPPEVLELLGVSATTFAVSKGIQAGGDLKPKVDPTSKVDPAPNGNKPAGT
jgi:hypothetical protein